MAKRKPKQKTGKEQSHLNIDPAKHPTAREVMYVAGALATMGMDKGISPKYQEVARVSSIWLSRVAITLYETEEAKAKETNEHQINEENGSKG